MKRLVCGVMTIAVLLICMMVVVACDKFEGKTFEYGSIDVCYITEINEYGKVTKTETMSIDSYCKDVLGLTDADARWVKEYELKNAYGIRENKFVFSRRNTVKDIFENVDSVTGKVVSEVTSYSYELEGNAIQITRSDLDDNGCGFEYTERIEIVTSSQLQKSYWGSVNYSTIFDDDDVANKSIYCLVVNYMSY